MTDTKDTTAELIEFLDDIIEDGECGLIDVMMDADEGLPLLKKIREILEQQTKPKVTREEIVQWVEIANREYNGAITHIVDGLKSKGVEVEEKP